MVRSVSLTSVHWNHCENVKQLVSIRPISSPVAINTMISRSLGLICLLHSGQGGALTLHCLRRMLTQDEEHVVPAETLCGAAGWSLLMMRCTTAVGRGIEAAQKYSGDYLLISNASFCESHYNSICSRLCSRT